MKIKTLTLLACSIVAVKLATLSSSAAVNLIFNGGFESSVITSRWLTLSAGSSTLTGWTISSGSIEILNNSYWQPSEGFQSVDTSGNSSGKIQQTIVTVPGSTYRLTFDLAGNPDGGPTIKTLQVGLNSSAQIFTFDTTGVSYDDMKWSARSWDFTATSSSTLLSFQNIGSTPYGTAIDNVSLVVIPEPTAILPMGLLILRFGLKRIR